MPYRFQLKNLRVSSANPLDGLPRIASVTCFPIIKSGGARSARFLKDFGKSTGRLAPYRFHWQFETKIFATTDERLRIKDFGRRA